MRRLRSSPAEGSACTFDSDCAIDQSCGGGTCKPQAYLDEPCSASKPCGILLNCENGICVRGSKPEGASCVDFFECGPGLLCDSGVCARTRIRQLGEPCDDFALDWCAGDTVCPLDPPYVCTAEPIAGEPCNSQLFDLCAGTARCIVGLCTEVDPLQCQ